MAKLKFEIWETSQSTECSAVSEGWDRVREPGAVRLESFHASTHEEAMNHYHRRMGWGPYKPVSGYTDITFRDEQVSEQEAYLSVRSPVWA